MPVGFPSRIVGVEYDAATVVAVLEQIGCAVSRSGEVLSVTPPSWRPDLRTAEDLVEEVARIHGYEQIPSVLPTPPGGSGLTHGQRVRRLVSTVLAAQGLSEVWGAPFVGEERLAALGLDVAAETARTVRLANPLSDEQPLLRTSVLSTMVDVLRRNLARGARDVGLFELGLVVALEGPQAAAPTEDVGILPSEEVLAAVHAAVPPQPRHLGLLMAGDRDRAGWWGAGRRADIHDVLDLVRSVGEALGVPLVVAADDPMPWHPGRCARVALADGSLVGYAGELHPKALAALGLPERCVGAELDLDVLTRAAETTVRARTLATHPMAQSDVALVVEASVPAASVREALRAGGGELLEGVQLFDVYQGDQVGEGRKSLAYRLTFRSTERTLTTEEVSAMRDAAVATAAERVGAVQRV